MNSAAANSDLLSVDDTLDLLLSRAVAVSECEQVKTPLALGRTLANALHAGADVPGWANSAMDGYALLAADMDSGPEATLRVSQRISAGSVGVPLEPGTAARIFTGAPIPPGADAVVMQERCVVAGDRVVIKGQVTTNDNIRHAGEDVRKGDLILKPGVRLSPQHLGLAASSGFADLSVYRPLRVAILSTGDELVPAGEPLAMGQIHDSNRHCFLGLLAALGCEVVDYGLVADNLEVTGEVLAKASQDADLVLASGGVSVGEEDHVKAAVEKLGQLQFWRVAIRPGKPLAFGDIGGVPFFGLPGNPVAMFVAFCIFVRPFILASQGRADIAPRTMHVRAGFHRDRADPRREFMRARLRMNDAGVDELQLYHSRSSGVLSSLTWADGLAVFKENRTLKNGDYVEFLPFASLLY